MQDYLSKLNEKQYEAATTTEGPILILAGAGSGKTGTMTHRIAYMIKDAGIDPYSILAVTFTNKAAAEMRERVEQLVGPVRGMWIQTFHSACLRILRSDADKLGYNLNFVVHDTVDQKALIKKIVKDLKYDERIYNPTYVLREISNSKSKGISASEYGHNGIQFDMRHEEISEIYTRYEKQFHKNNAMDFDDLILNVVNLFEEFPEVLEHYRKKFRYIMVDEYQDTNMSQYDLLRYLAGAHRNICVVGDDDQSIYEWRGADIRNILEFEKDFPGAKVIKLEQNYRSTSNILGAAHSVISKNRSRKAKKLWTDAGAGEKIEYYRASDDREEARWTAEKIKALMRKDRSLNFSDFAILYRTNVQSRRFEESFSGKDIPYQVLSGLRYYDRKEIKDMMCYMRLVLNPDDDTSMLRIINEPRRGIGDKSVQNLQAIAASLGCSLAELLTRPDALAALSAKAAAEAERLGALISSLNVESERLSVEEVYDILLEKSGYLKALEDAQSVEADGRIENIMEFKSVILEKKKEAEAFDEPLTLQNFMEGIALMADVDNHDRSQDAVALMTLHSAKGLEFPVVFMPGMELGIFPSYRKFDENEGIEEERRLCYVGMTRAKNRLFMSSAEERTLYGKKDNSVESPFLHEIDRKYLSGDALYDRKDPGLSFDRYDSYAPFKKGPYISPLAEAAELKRQARRARKDTLEGEEISAGEQVEHPKFGTGTVIECKGNVITVIFDEFGTKKLAKDLAPLKKIEG